MAMDATLSTEAGSSPKKSGARGRVVLSPIEGSIERIPLSIELDLTRDDGVLVLGDLRRAAEFYHQNSSFEVAYRLWAVVKQAASRLDHDPLVARSVAMGDGALQQLRRIGGSREANLAEAGQPPSGRRGVSYDYVSLASDCAAGLTQRETATKWECSPGTVSRAVRYVAIREELMESCPEVARQIHVGTAVNDLATQHGIETKVMRWIVSDYWDRRT